MRGTPTTTFLLDGCRGRGGRAVIGKSLCLCGGPLRHQLREGEANEEGEFKHNVDSGALHLLLLESGERVRAYHLHAHCAMHPRARTHM